VLFSSSLWPYKGATLLVDALAELERKQPELDWECRFIGKDPSGGAELGRLNDAVARHGLGRRVTIVGNVAFGDIWQEYVDADVLAYPSLLESFGLPALEAMACATVVVASDIPALREVVGDAGVLVDPRDTSAFADELVEVVGSPARRQQLVEAGRRRAAEMTWDATAEGVVAAARAVVARTRTGDSRK
jgi:glycosyltransferase involved in cell wall biosynthesis